MSVLLGTTSVRTAAPPSRRARRRSRRRRAARPPGPPRTRRGRRRGPRRAGPHARLRSRSHSRRLRCAISRRLRGAPYAVPPWPCTPPTAATWTRSGWRSAPRTRRCGARAGCRGGGSPSAARTSAGRARSARSSRTPDAPGVRRALRPHPADEESLDKWEGVDIGLFRKLRVRVQTLDGEAAAWIYVLDAYEGGLPSARYLGMLADAAEAGRRSRRLRGRAALAPLHLGGLATGALSTASLRRRDRCSRSRRPRNRPLRRRPRGGRPPGGAHRRGHARRRARARLRLGAGRGAARRDAGGGPEHRGAGLPRRRRRGPRRA